MTRLANFLGARPKGQLLILGFLGVILVGLVDYGTGPEISFSIFYLVPISLVAWWAGDRAGVALSFIAALAWLLADLFAGREYSYGAIPYWNAAVRLSLFLIVSFALARLQAAQKRQEELSEFIVHDLRSPLSNVIMSLDLLKTLESQNLNANQLSLVHMSLSSAGRMLTLVNSILDLARLEKGQMPLQQANVNPEVLVNAAFAQLSVLAARKNVELVLQQSPEATLAHTDAELTIRVLVNLLGNAVKFSDPAAKVTVIVDRFAADMLCLAVVDQGQGIPSEWATRIFEKFTQVDSKKSSGAAVGSVLGLSFCRLAVEALGGRIWLDTTVSRGTTIVFTLPAGVSQAGETDA